MPRTLDSNGTARERLLGAAAELFYAHGIAATGINAITERAGVARMSLYNNFATKDDLVTAYIDARHAEWLDLYQRRTAAADDPRARVLAVFDAYLDHAEFAYPHGFRGCGLLNAAAELPADSPARGAVRRHKEEVEAILSRSLTEAGAEDPENTAIHLSLLLEGAMARAGLAGSESYLTRAREFAGALLADA